MTPQYKIKLQILLIFLIFSGFKIVAQNNLASMYHKLQENQPDLFEDLFYDWEAFDYDSGQMEKTIEKDPYKRSRYLLNLSVLGNSIYQGVVLSFAMSEIETLGTPPFTYNIYNRTALGKAFPLLFTGGMSIGSIIINYKKPVNPGLASAYMYGSLTGLLHGTFITSAFTRVDSSSPNRSFFLMGGLMSLAKGLWMTNFSKRNQFTSQEIDFAITSSFWGGFMGGCIGDIVTGGDPTGKGISIGLASGSIISTYLSKSLMKNRSITGGDLIVMNSAAGTGLLMGISINVFSANRLTSALGYITSIGSTLAGSYILTKHYSFTDIDGIKIVGGTSLGVLAGVVLIAGTQPTEIHSILFPIVSGAILGWAATTYHIMKRSHNRDHIIYRRQKKTNKLYYNLNPSGIVLNFRNQDAQLQMMQMGLSMDIVQLQYRF